LQCGRRKRRYSKGVEDRGRVPPPSTRCSCAAKVGSSALPPSSAFAFFVALGASALWPTSVILGECENASLYSRQRQCAAIQLRGLLVPL
jgi:hypothetical protein